MNKKRKYWRNRFSDCRVENLRNSQLSMNLFDSSQLRRSVGVNNTPSGR